MIGPTAASYVGPPLFISPDAEVSAMSDEQVTQQPGGEMVPFADPNDSFLDVFGDGGVAKGRFWCSLRPKSGDEKLALYNTLNGDNLKFDDVINVEKGLVHVALQSGTMVEDGSGELIPYVRTVLLFDDGTSAAGTSKMVAKSIRSMLQAGITPPFNPPLRITLLRKPVGNGPDGQPRNIIYIAISKTQPPASAATKKRP